jgi:hypothetical protein
VRPHGDRPSPHRHAAKSPQESPHRTAQLGRLESAIQHYELGLTPRVSALPLLVRRRTPRCTTEPIRMTASQLPFGGLPRLRACSYGVRLHDRRVNAAPGLILSSPLPLGCMRG